jgi:hypothetical protein
MMSGADTIFVGIAAMNEVDTFQTISNALLMASRPELLSFGVWSQTTHGEVFSFDDPRVRIVNVDYPISLGLGVARACVAALYNNEEYYYQIDAHMLFQKDWDRILVSSHRKLEEKFDKPIISYFGQMWRRAEDGSIEGYDQNSGIQGSPMAYSTEHRSFGLPINIGHPSGGAAWLTTDDFYLEHHNIQGGYIFARSEFLLDVGHDPQLMFFGEELLLAMRAWTRGYRIFALRDPIQWHKDRWSSNKHEFERDVVENTQRPPSTPQGALWDSRQAQSMRRVQSIFKGDILGHWGAPSKEALNEYLTVSGLGAAMKLEEFEPFTKDLE